MEVCPGDQRPICSGSQSAAGRDHRFEIFTGISFRDKTLLQRALPIVPTSTSRAFLQADNERLEILGMPSSIS